jgi:hypothetical protein
MGKNKDDDHPGDAIHDAQVQAIEDALAEGIDIGDSAEISKRMSAARAKLKAEARAAEAELADEVWGDDDRRSIAKFLEQQSRTPNNCVRVNIRGGQDAIRAELREWCWARGNTLDELTDDDDKADRFWAECEAEGAALFFDTFLDGARHELVAPILSIGGEDQDRIAVIYLPTVLDCVDLTFKLPEIFGEWVARYAADPDDEDAEDVTEFVSFLRRTADEIEAARQRHKEVAP